MTKSLLFSLLLLILLSLVFAMALPGLLYAGTTPTDQQPVDAAKRFVVEGTVRDATSGEPIPFATVRVLGTGRSALANKNGAFRIVLDGDSATLKFSHISHYSRQLTLTRSDSVATVNVELQPAVINIGEMTVYTRDYDPAQRIILEAIRRKQDILSKLHDYQCDAYVKLVVDNREKPDSSKIFLLTETQMTAYWQYPDKYKEIITARKQSANLEAEFNQVTVGEILNFNANRIDLGRYLVVSPTAKDALDYYNYYLVDTLYIDSLQVFKLEIEPKNPDNPLFVGHIDIADSTYDVVEVDVGFSRGVDLSMVKNLRYVQRFAQFRNEYWMPVAIRFSGDLDIRVPIPGIPTKLSFAHVASLHDYHFDEGIPKGTFNEYVLEVDKKADDVDSTQWNAGQQIPLTEPEKAAYARIDSVENAPPTAGKRVGQLVGLATFAAFGGAPDLFHYNRAEGAYLGFGGNLRDVAPNTDLSLSTGYAFAPKRVEFDARVTHRVPGSRNLEIRVNGFHKYGQRPTFGSGQAFGPTLDNLIYQWDPADYYRTHGFEVSASMKAISRSRFTLTYHNSHDFSAPLLEDYSLFRDTSNHVRPNPPIAEGRLRTLGGVFTIDSNDRIMDKGREIVVFGQLYTSVSIGGEISNPDFLNSDFDYRRYWASVYSRFRLPGLGVTSIKAFGGASDGNLPPQRYFTAGYSAPAMQDQLGYRTFGEHNFYGRRAAGLLYQHNFYRTLWVKSGLPLIKHIPFWLTTHGGFFWSDFRANPAQVDSDIVGSAAKPYREFGVGLANLTPFIAPFNFFVTLSWQASHYGTNVRTWGFGISL